MDRRLFALVAASLLFVGAGVGYIGATVTDDSDGRADECLAAVGYFNAYFTIFEGYEGRPASDEVVAQLTKATEQMDRACLP